MEKRERKTDIDTRERLKEAENMMKQNGDKRRVDKEYAVGEMVYLKLLPLE